MAVTLNKKALEKGMQLVAKGKFVADQKEAWREHRPSPEREDEYIRLHGFDEYGNWHLGVDDEKAANTKETYHFPYGDFENVHRCGVLYLETTVGQNRYFEIAKAAAHLHGMIDGAKRSTKTRFSAG
jgi:hypothetical protein